MCTVLVTLNKWVKTNRRNKYCRNPLKDRGITSNTDAVNDKTNQSLEEEHSGDQENKNKGQGKNFNVDGNVSYIYEKTLSCTCISCM